MVVSGIVYYRINLSPTCAEHITNPYKQRKVKSTLIIKKGKVFLNVEGEMKETKDTTFIGFVLLGLAKDNKELELNI